MTDDLQRRQIKTNLNTTINTQKSIISKSRSNSHFGSFHRHKQLYEDAFRAAHAKKQRQSYQNKLIKQKSEKRKTSKLSNKITDFKFEQTVNKIFDILDSDYDGEISAKRICITKLQPRKLTILAPLLIEMEDLGIAMDRVDFFQSVKNLIRNISIVDKRVLLDERNEVEEEEDRTRRRNSGNDNFKVCLSLLEFFRLG